MTTVPESVTSPAPPLTRTEYCLAMALPVLFALASILELVAEPLTDPKPRPILTAAAAQRRQGNVKAAEFLLLYLIAMPRSLESPTQDGNRFKANTYRMMAQTNLSSLYLDSGRLNEGRLLLEPIIAHGHPSPELVINLAVAYLRLRMLPAALWLLTEYQSLCADQGLYWLNLGQVQQVSGQCADANQSYRKARDLDFTLPLFQCKPGQ